MLNKTILENLVFNADFNNQGAEPKYYLAGTIYMDIVLDKTVHKYSDEKLKECICLSHLEQVDFIPELMGVKFADHKDKTVKKYKEAVNKIIDKLNLVITRIETEKKVNDKKIISIELHKLKK